MTPLLWALFVVNLMAYFFLVLWMPTLLTSAHVPLGQAEEVGWKIQSEGGTYTIIGYNKTDQQLFVDRTHSGRVDFSNASPARTAAPLTVKGPLQLNILVDRCSIEVFAQDGRVAITNLVFPEDNAYTVKFYSHGGRPGPMKAALWNINSAW